MQIITAAGSGNTKVVSQGAAALLAAGVAPEGIAAERTSGPLVEATRLHDPEANQQAVTLPASPARQPSAAT